MLDTSPEGTQFNLNDIRIILADQIRGHRAGTSSAASVNAICNATGKILSSVKLEMEYYKAIGKTPNIDMILGQASLPNGVGQPGIDSAPKE